MLIFYLENNELRLGIKSWKIFQEYRRTMRVLCEDSNCNSFPMKSYLFLLINMKITMATMATPITVTNTATAAAVDDGS